MNERIIRNHTDSYTGPFQFSLSVALWCIIPNSQGLYITSRCMLTCVCWGILFLHFVATKSEPSLTFVLIRPIKAQIQVPGYRNHKLYTTKTIMLSIGLLLISILGLSCLSSSIFKQDQALAQQYIPTIK